MQSYLFWVYSFVYHKKIPKSSAIITSKFTIKNLSRDEIAEGCTSLYTQNKVEPEITNTWIKTF